MSFCNKLSREDRLELIKGNSGFFVLNPALKFEMWNKTAHRLII